MKPNYVRAIRIPKADIFQQQGDRKPRRDEGESNDKVKCISLLREGTRQIVPIGRMMMISPDVRYAYKITGGEAQGQMRWPMKWLIHE